MSETDDISDEYWYKTRILRSKPTSLGPSKRPDENDWCGDPNCSDCDDGMACCGWWQHWSTHLDLILCNARIDLGEFCSTEQFVEYIRKNMKMDKSNNEGESI